MDVTRTIFSIRMTSGWNRKVFGSLFSEILERCVHGICFSGRLGSARSVVVLDDLMFFST